VDGGDDLGGVDPLQINRGDAEVGVPQLALDDVERDALVGEFDGVGVAELLGRELIQSQDQGEKQHLDDPKAALSRGPGRESLLGVVLQAPAGGCVVVADERGVAA
jgi:hypothetical protein